MKFKITLLLLLIGGIAYGQSSKQEPTPIVPDTLDINDRYERMLLDSLIVLETLKPVHHKLELAYAARGEEIRQAWALVRMHEMQDKLSSERIEKLDADLRKSKRRYWFKGFGYGAGGAIILLTLKQLVTH